MDSGTQFGPYEIVEKIGAGGMGEVYRARDARLRRHVALKVLTEDISGDESALGRFKKEARFLAELNHPHIAQIYGIEVHEGRVGLVLELVEGPSIDARLRAIGNRRGTGEVGEAAARLERMRTVLRLGQQLASALDYAHERGILHRDLKPANLRLTRDGQLKVLDFGIAKHFAASEATGSTWTTQVGDNTIEGSILGTASYMSPEQVRGEELDRRSDVWSFGCVLFEMLAGQSAFRGDRITETFARVLTAEPEWRLIADDMPPALLRILQRCLEKDPERRMRNMGDVFLEFREIEESLTRPDHLAHADTDRWDGSAVGRARPRGRRGLLFVAALVVVSVGGYLWTSGKIGGAAQTGRASTPVRFVVEAPEGVRIPELAAPVLALSPDGDALVFVGIEDGVSRLYRRPLQELSSTVIPGTEGASSPFYSPDGVWIGFHAEGMLRKLDLRDGRIVDVCESGALLGACWTTTDSIYFCPGMTEALHVVPAGGGSSTPITRNETGSRLVSHSFPVAAPEPGIIIFVEFSDWLLSPPSIVLHSRATGETKRLLENACNPSFGAEGQLYFERDGGIYSVVVDLAKFEVTSSPARRERQAQSTGQASLATSPGGVLAYRLDPEAHNDQGLDHQDRLVWVSRDGTRETIEGRPAFVMLPSLSPDGQRLAYTICEDGDCDVWIQDLRRGVATLFQDGQLSHAPVWSPQGDAIYFSSNRDGEANVYRRSLRADANVERITESPHHQDPVAVTPDGGSLVVWSNPPETGGDLMLVDLAGPGEPTPLVQSSAAEAHTTFSPDGRYFAFTSSRLAEKGAHVYVQPFGRTGERVQISIDGGTQPIWNPRGGEIFFRSVPDTALMVVDVELASPDVAGGAGAAGAEGDLHFSRPRVLIPGRFRPHVAGVPNYAYHPATDRFVMVEIGESPLRKDVISVVLGAW